MLSRHAMPCFVHVTPCQAENEAAEGIGEAGCTFWQYNPTETYASSGIVVDGAEALEPGRARLENRGMMRCDMVLYRGARDRRHSRSLTVAGAVAHGDACSKDGSGSSSSSSSSAGQPVSRVALACSR